VQVPLPRKLYPLLKPKRIKVARGGRGGGKSWGFGNVLLALSRRRKLRVVNAREIQKSIKQSVYTLYKDRIDAFGLSREFQILENSITNLRTGSEFTFTGLREHTSDSVKSLEGCDIFWIEEAHSVSQTSLDLVIPTIRKPGSEIWVTYNQTLDADPIHQYVAEIVKYQPELIELMEISLDDNPWATQEMRDARALAYLTDPVKAAQIWGGQTKQIVDGAVYEQQISKLIADHRLSEVVDIDPSAVSVLAFDLGRGDATSVILGNYVGPERRICWSYEKNGEYFTHYIQVVKDNNIRIDHIILPHDAKAKTISTLKSVEEMCKEAWPTATITVLPPDSVELGIDNVRSNFHRLYVNPTKASKFWAMIRRYARKPTGLVNAEGKPLYGDPLHDEASHFADCLRYWMQYNPIVKEDSSAFLRNLTTTPAWSTQALFG